MTKLIHVLLMVVIRTLGRCRTQRKKGRTLCSLWAGHPVLNMGINARAECLLGIDARSLVFEHDHIRGAFTYDLAKWRRLPIIGRLSPYGVLLWAVWKFDRFHFYCDRGILVSPEPFTFNWDELELLKKLKKEVFCWAYGADVRSRERTESLGQYNCCMECPQPGSFCICNKETADKYAERIRNNTTAVFSMGDMIHYTPNSINNVFYWPVELEVEKGVKYKPYIPRADSTAALRVVHAPNNRAYKGTRFLMSAVEKLQGEGVSIELQLIEKLSNEEALKLYQQADVLFDQCLIGFHGYTAQEGMALGKPVICYIRDPERYLLDSEACPILSANPEQLEDTLRDLANDRMRVHQLGAAGRRYIEQRHTPIHFAARLHQAYKQLNVEAGKLP
jgi:hypothetical protein